MAYLFYSLLFLFLATATVLYATRATWLPHAPPIPYLTAPGPIPSSLYDTYDYLTTHPPLSWLRSSSSSSSSSNQHSYVRLPTSFSSVSVSSPNGLNSGSFSDDAAAGFSSERFDLAGNIEGGDGRAGLDARAKSEVGGIMKARGLGFDEARRVYVEERFGRENIGRDGRPLDRKAVMFDRL